MAVAPKTRKPKVANPAATGFRFSHRGARDYAHLLRHYRDKFNLAQPLVVRSNHGGFALWSETP